jgi:pheromone receptor transcription factor
MLLVASETGHVYAFSTNKLKPMIVSDAGKTLIQNCLNTPEGWLTNFIENFEKFRSYYTIGRGQST